MANTPVRFSDWQPQHQDAMLELDACKLWQRILYAHIANSERANAGP